MKFVVRENGRNPVKITIITYYRNDRTDGPLGGAAICVKSQIGHRVASIPKLQFIEIITENNKIFITEQGGSVVTHETCIREVAGSNPVAGQPD